MLKKFHGIIDSGGLITKKTMGEINERTNAFKNARGQICPPQSLGGSAKNFGGNWDLGNEGTSCPRGDSNSHRDLTPQRILSPVRLPIPPLGHVIDFCMSANDTAFFVTTLFFKIFLRAISHLILVFYA